MFKEDMDAIAAHLENMVKSKTIVGEPIMAGNATVIPIISASFGFALGDGEGSEPNKGGLDKLVTMVPEIISKISDLKTKKTTETQQG